MEVEMMMTLNLTLTLTLIQIPTITASEIQDASKRYGISRFRKSTAMQMKCSALMQETLDALTARETLKTETKNPMQIIENSEKSFTFQALEQEAIEVSNDVASLEILRMLFKSLPYEKRFLG